MTQLLDTILSIIVYSSSFGLLAISLHQSRLVPSPSKRKIWLVVGGIIIFLIALSELPLSGLPFWSRDFSFTWQLLVIDFAAIMFLINPILEKIRIPQDSIPEKTIIGLTKLVGAESKLSDDFDTVTLTTVHTSLDQPQLKRSQMRLVVLLLTIAYIFGALRQLLLVNRDMTFTDQSAYMHYAIKMVDTQYSHIGERNRMPLYPHLQSLFYRAGMDESEYFVRGKYVNLGLSMVILAIIYGVFRRYFNQGWAFLLALVTGFTVYIFKAGWFQAELVFYVFNFVLFLTLLEFLRQPAYKTGIFLGIVAGYAHLTKASVLPGLVLFSITFFILLGRKYLCERSTRSLKLRLGTIIQHSSQWVVALVFFFLVVFPYIKNSWYRFGPPFYNVNSTFYFWYDSWEEAVAGTRAHGDRRGWPSLPNEEIPSLNRYIAEHSFSDIGTRLWYGGGVVLNSVVKSYGYHKYVIIVVAMILVSMMVRWRYIIGGFRRNFAAVGFLSLYFVTYFLLYSWYAPIAEGNRLILAQFLPLIFVLSTVLKSLLGNSSMKIRDTNVRWSTIAASFLVSIALVDLILIISSRIHMYGGA